MNTRFTRIAAIAAATHGIISLDRLHAEGIPQQTVSRWVGDGLLNRLGSRSFAVCGAPHTWEMHLAAALADLGSTAAIAGRSGAALCHLDGFVPGPVELLMPLARRRKSPHRVGHTSRPIARHDIQTVNGLTVLRAERLILESPLFDFTTAETENAIDSAIRLRLTSEQRLRTKVVEHHHRGVNGGRQLLDAMVDSGGESRLERWLLKLVRESGLPRPMLQKIFRSGGRTVARVDAFFPGGLVVEVAGHGTHATRRQRQVDAQRHTELTLRGLRVVTFTYDDVRDRPDWVLARLREACRMAA